MEAKQSMGLAPRACIIVRTHILKTRSYGLVNHWTVFQAELYTIRKACKLLPEIKRANEKGPNFLKIMIPSDSQAALQALGNIDTNSKLVEETKNALNELSKHVEVELEVE